MDVHPTAGDVGEVSLGDVPRGTPAMFRSPAICIFHGKTHIIMGNIFASPQKICYVLLLFYLSSIYIGYVMVCHDLLFIF